MLLFSSIVFNLRSQTKQEFNSRTFIMGKVIDSSSGQPLEYATISMYFIHNKKPVNGTTTDSLGNFKIKDLQYGNYKVVIEYIGYNPFIRNNVLINQHILSLNLKTVSLVKKASLLQTVTVEGNKKIIENKKKEYK